MKRPNLKLDGRHGTLRWVTRDGQKRSRGDRIGRLFYVFAAQMTLIGATGLELRLAGRQTWHKIELSDREAYDLLNGHFMTSTILKQTLAWRRTHGMPEIPTE